MEVDIIKTHAIDFNFKSFTSKNISLDKHYHNGYQIIFITKGSADFKINGKLYNCSKNTIVFINNLEEHTMKIKNLPYSRYDLILDSIFLDTVIIDMLLLSIFKIRNESFKHAFTIDEEDVEYVNEIFKSFYYLEKEREIFWHIKFTSLFLEFILFLYKKYEYVFPTEDINKKNKVILNVHNYIDLNFTSNFTIDDLSSKFFISKYHLIRSFKSIIGYTIKEYTILKRMRLAKDYLYFTNKSILDISLECGYNDQSNFIRAFRDREGVTPLQFRKSYKKSLND